VFFFTHKVGWLPLRNFSLDTDLSIYNSALNENFFLGVILFCLESQVRIADAITRGIKQNRGVLEKLRHLEADGVDLSLFASFPCQFVLGSLFCLGSLFRPPCSTFLASV